VPEPTRTSEYQRLVESTRVPPPPPRSLETDLDKLIACMKERKRRQAEPAPKERDRVQELRELMVRELVGVFVELMEKYRDSGVSMEMDASSFLEGGREIRFDFAFGEFRIQMLGTVTTEAIAFHETRHFPDVRGELVSGPMLRLRSLNARVFRDFICERLAVLIRAVMRHR
jgi:hypothetical protein